MSEIQNAANKKNILIVEDSPTQKEALRFLLEESGYSVICAADGREGLEAVRSNEIDLVISDILMPEMDGYGLCRALRNDEKYRQLPVILLTSLIDPHDIIKGLDSGANNFISKPYNDDTLITRIQHILANQELRKDTMSEMGITILFTGQKFFITADRMQILDLLLSTYENAVSRNKELLDLRDELNALNEQLESKVSERTVSLEAEIEAHKEAEEALHFNNEIATIFGTVSDEETFANVLSIVLQVLHSPIGAFGYLNEDGDLVVPTMTRQECVVYPDSGDTILFTRDALVTSSWGHTIREKAYTLSNEPSVKTPEWHIPIQRNLSMSILAKDSVIGLIAVANKETDYTEEDVRNLEYIVRQLGPLLNTRLQRDKFRNDLEKRERDLKEAQSIGNVGNWEYDIEKKSIVWSDEVYALYERDPASGPPAVEEEVAYYSPEQAKTLRAYAQHAIESGENLQYDLQAVLPSGKIRWFSASMHPIKDRDGHIKHLFGTVQDVTERKRVQENDRLSKNVLELINRQEFGTDLIRNLIRLVCDTLGIQAAGIRIKNGYDYPFYETIGFPDDFVQADSRLCAYDETGSIIRDADGQALVECVCGNVLRGHTDSSHPFYTPYGSFWTNTGTEFLAVAAGGNTDTRLRDPCCLEAYESITLIPLRTDKEVIGILQLCDTRRDRFDMETINFLESLSSIIGSSISRKQAQEAALLAALQWKATFDSISDVIWILDSDNRIIQANNATELFFDCTRASAIGKHCWEVAHGTEQPIPECPNLRSQTSLKREIQEVKNGDRWLEITVNPLLGANGRYNGAMHIISDITEQKKQEEERKRLEEQLRASQKLEAIGSLAGGIAHDFNNLLSVILSYSRFVLGAIKDGDPIKDDLLEVKAAAERAAALTRQLLAFSRKQVLQPVQLNLNDILSGIKKMLQRILGEDIEFHDSLAKNLGTILADPSQVEQVIMNIVINARDAMPEGGKLTIETSNAVFDDEYATTHSDVRPGSYVQLCISDTGCGMDDITKARIFEPFFTTKGQGKGTGLGLSTVYGIVKQSGGNILVYSEVGRGTTFKIYFPHVSGTGTSYEKKDTQSSERATGSETILLVEDEPALLKIARRTLEEAGYLVLTAGDGEEAIRIATEHEGEIHLVLTDVVMPKMGGRILVQTLKKLRPSLKVIYMSGYTDDAILNHGVLDPGINFIGKPFNSDNLERKVREVLDQDSRPCSFDAEQKAAPAKITGKPELGVLENEIGKLSPECMTKIRKASTAARYDELVELIESIRDDAPNLADEMKRLADEYDFLGILRLTGNGAMEA